MIKVFNNRKTEVGVSGERFSETDKRAMRSALTLARRGLGNVWPNPSVGCVILDPEGSVVGRGWTQPRGRPHAETEALSRAGDKAQGATVYVTLEPCNHHGKTPPCTEALIAAGVKRVVSTFEDPDPRVSGAGFARLREAGITVSTGLYEEEARRLQQGFLVRHSLQRPYVALKTATSLDGKIALSSGESQWITGAEARQYAHRMRSEFDAVLVGGGTARADDPSLTCRLPGYNKPSPVRILMSAHPKEALDEASKLRDGAATTWLITTEAGRASLLSAAVADNGPSCINGIDDIIVVPEDGAEPTISPVLALREIADRGVTRLMVEGGGTLAASLLKEDLVDEVHWARAPKIIGADGLPSVSTLALASLVESERFERRDMLGLGLDEVTVYTRSQLF